MFGLGVGEILVILVIALVFIGPKKLPELAKTLGKGFSEFQNAMRGITNTVQNPMQNHQNQQPNQPDHNDPHIQGRPQQPQGQYHDDHIYKDDPPHDQNLPEDEQEILDNEAGEMAHSKDQKEN